MIDPRTIPDLHGLSEDSLRGSEAMIRPDLVGNTSVTNPLDPSKNFNRDPLSYHEARTLLLRGDTVKDEAVHPDVVLHNESEKERLPVPGRNEVQMQAMPDIQDPDYLAWKKERTEAAARERAEYDSWKASQQTGTAPSIAAVQATQETQSYSPPASGPSVSEATPPQSGQQLYSSPMTVPPNMG